MSNRKTVEELVEYIAKDDKKMARECLKRILKDKAKERLAQEAND